MRKWHFAGTLPILYSLPFSLVTLVSSDSTIPTLANSATLQTWKHRNTLSNDLQPTTTCTKKTHTNTSLNTPHPPKCSKKKRPRNSHWMTLSCILSCHVHSVPGIWTFSACFFPRPSSNVHPNLFETFKLSIARCSYLGPTNQIRVIPSSKDFLCFKSAGLPLKISSGYLR